MNNFYFFSKNLRTFLFAKDMTNAQLAEVLRVGAHSTIGKWISENRPPKPVYMEKLAAYMGFSEDDILHRDLTLEILHNSKYTELPLVSESAEEYRNKKVEAMATYILDIQDRLQAIIDDGNKALKVAGK